MKFLLGLTLFIFVFPAMAAGECFLHEVQGSVKSKQDHLELVLAPGTQSEMKFKIPISLQSNFFPYINNWIKTEIVFNTKVITYQSVINNVISVKRAIPDPLNAGGAMHKLVSEKKCL